MSDGLVGLEVQKELKQKLRKSLVILLTSHISCNNNKCLAFSGQEIFC